MNSPLFLILLPHSFWVIHPLGCQTLLVSRIPFIQGTLPPYSLIHWSLLYPSPFTASLLAHYFIGLSLLLFRNTDLFMYGCADQWGWAAEKRSPPAASFVVGALWLIDLCHDILVHNNWVSQTKTDKKHQPNNRITLYSFLLGQLVCFCRSALWNETVDTWNTVCTAVRLVMWMFQNTSSFFSWVCNTLCGEPNGWVCLSLLLLCICKY